MREAVTAAASAEPERNAEHLWRAGRDRLARSGIDLTVAPMVEAQMEFPIDVHCQRTRPGPTAYRQWRDYYDEQARAMVLSDSTVIASALSDGVRVLLGFASVTERGALRIVYVKLRFRGNGIGLRLLEAAGVAVPVRIVKADGGWGRWAAYHGLPWWVA